VVDSLCIFIIEGDYMSTTGFGDFLLSAVGDVVGGYFDALKKRDVESKQKVNAIEMVKGSDGVWRMK
jgi:hypothetical protein